jgi:hypothetical protein
VDHENHTDISNNTTVGDKNYNVPRRLPGENRRICPVSADLYPSEHRLAGFRAYWYHPCHPGKLNPSFPGCPGTLRMAQYTRYQQKVIRNYYDNRDAISLQRVQELVTELYLSEGKKREKNWASLASHLEKLGVPRQQIDHLVKQNDPEVVAKFVKQLMAK